MERLDRYVDVFSHALAAYGRYLVHDVTAPGLQSYFYGLIGVSVLVYAWELVAPWRRGQARIRRDFWLDAFYMFFNFFLFSLLGFHAVASVVERLFIDLRVGLGLESIRVVDVSAWPGWAQLLALLVFRDFIHYWIHRLLHRVPALWRFHQVHHSVQEMGFAAHLRYHWMETVVYRGLEYIPLGLIGFGLQEFFLVHMFTLTIGHINHANVVLPLGPLRYVLNSPQMHLWHHAKKIHVPYGINFGLTLSLWDWLFGTAHWPADDPDIELGFDDVERFPSGFFGQMWGPFAGVLGSKRLSS